MRKKLLYYATILTAIGSLIIIYWLDEDYKYIIII